MSQTSHRVLQIHVTRKCNLKCLHCYSSSGPTETEALDIADLKLAVSDAHALGYTFVTLSGGEPFLYPDLAEILTHAKGLGLVTGIVTNGMFLDARRLNTLKPVLDLVVVSLDGAPKRHNMMRANPAAFEVMAGKLPALRDSGISFGFLFTLSADNAHELDWAADFAVESGAAMMQVHPLEVEVGRAAETDALAGLEPDESVGVVAGRRAWEAQQRLGDAIRIIVDLRPRAPQEPDRPRASCGGSGRFADMVTTLCIETDGTFVPLGHGFSRRYEIGALGAGRLKDMAEVWVSGAQAEDYVALVRQVQLDADAASAPVVQNMAQSLRRASYEDVGIAAQ